jgi:hypothetical protein
MSWRACLPGATFGNLDICLGLSPSPVGASTGLLPLDLGDFHHLFVVAGRGR